MYSISTKEAGCGLIHSAQSARPYPISVSQGKHSLYAKEFCDVIARLKNSKVEVSYYLYKLNDAAEIWRNSSVLGLAQFVLQMISEFELSLIEKGPQRDEILKNMAEQRYMKNETKDSYQTEWGIHNQASTTFRSRNCPCVFRLTP